MNRLEQDVGRVRKTVHQFRQEAVAPITTCPNHNVPQSQRAPITTCPNHNVPQSQRALITTCWSRR